MNNWNSRRYNGNRVFGVCFRILAGSLLATVWGILVLGLAQAWAGEEVSGRLVNGFRVLTVRELAASPDVAVFRGDYIKFELDREASGDKERHLSVPALDIEATLLPRLDPAPYFKMKQIGEFAYSLEEIRGIIRVIEYDGAHYQALTASEAQKIIKELNPLILDVRTPGEFNAGRIEGAKLLPVQVLEQNLSVLADYKEAPVLIYCATGNRSTVAAKILIDNGFERIFNLKGGIKDWTRHSLPVVK